MTKQFIVHYRNSKTKIDRVIEVDIFLPSNDLQMLRAQIKSKIHELISPDKISVSDYFGYIKVGLIYDKKDWYNNIKVDKIINIVGKCTNVNKYNIFATGGRKQNYVDARYMAIVAITHFCPYFRQCNIQKVLKFRDRSAVTYGINTFKLRYETEPEYKATFDKIIALIEQSKTN